MSRIPNKARNASYLNRKWLADIHTKRLNSLTTTKTRGDVKPLRAETWTKDKFNNKRNEPLSKQMERELSKFSRPQQPIYQIQNLPDTKDNDKERRTVPIIPNKEPPLKTTI